MGRGLLPPDHPCAVPGPVHAREVGALWDEADVVLAIGTDFDGMMTQNWLMPRPPTLISVNIDEADANKNYASDLTLVGDARAVLERLLPGDRRARRGSTSCDAVWPRSAMQVARGRRRRRRTGRRVPRDHGPRRSPGGGRRRRHVHPGLLARGLPAGAAAAQAGLPDGLGDARVRRSPLRSERLSPARARPSA